MIPNLEEIASTLSSRGIFSILDFSHSLNAEYEGKKIEEEILADPIETFDKFKSVFLKCKGPNILVILISPLDKFIYELIPISGICIFIEKSIVNEIWSLGK